MVAITSFFLLALSALPTFTDAAHIGRHNPHHRAALQARAATRACRDKVVPTPVKKLAKDTGAGASSASKSASSSAKPATTSKSTSSSGSKGSPDVGTPDVGSSSGSISKIFPLNSKGAISTFSTSPLAPKPLALSDAAFHPTHATKSNVYSYGPAPDGKKSLHAVYQRGSISPGHTDKSGGFSFYAPSPIDFTDGNTVTMSYSVYFQKGFKFNKGGKLPGLYGGDDDEIATKCSGGHHDPRCWSTRMMWREGGEGELYAYIPQTSQNSKALTAVPPHTGDNDAYGHSVGRGLWKWKTGAWTTISQRVTLNTPGKYDGSIEIYIDGKSMFVAHGLLFRSSAKGKVRGMQVQTFFGGHEADWASPQTQSAYFSDFSAAVYH